MKNVGSNATFTSGASTVVMCHGGTMTEYRNIKVSPEVFERLKRGKPEGETWSRYLDNLNEKAEEWDSRRSDVL